MSHFFVLVFALVWTLVQCSCPTMCRCNNHVVDAFEGDFYTVASCTEIPGNISQEFRDKLLEITFVNFNDTLPERIYDDLPNLRRVSFRNTTIYSSNFTVSNITYLDLSGNRIEVWNGLDEESDIKYLDISKNHLSVLEDYSFRTMNNLEVLNASFNNISVIEPRAFNHLNNIKCLDLSGNSIVKITHQVFFPITSLQYLNISYNFLNTLNEICLSSLSKLQHLDVSWNNLIEVDPGSLELPSLTKLLLSGNLDLGKSHDAVLVSTGQKLQTVDASRIGLQQVPPSLTLSIRTLKLADNKIKNINCGDLDSYPLLKMLDFTSNEIGFIEEDALGRLDSLTILFLSNNKIREIPKSLPEKLEVLRMEHNEVGRITEGDLQGLTKLEVLILNDNKIRIIEAKAFSQLVSLVTLDLSGNPLSVLQSGCFLGPNSLQVLRLSKIELIQPAKDVSFPLTSPEKLITLDLSDSPGLARQFLADTAALAASKELQELDLSNANLDEIRSDLLHYLAQLHSLHLSGNKLNCSHLHWLASWLRRQAEKENRKITCASPPELWGTLLINLQDNDVPISSSNILAQILTNNMSTKIKSKSSYTKVSDSPVLRYREKSTTLFVDIVPNTVRHWNGTADELSSTEKDVTKNSFHPGMIILFIGVLGAVAVIVMFASKFTRKTLAIQNRDIEVSSLPSVTELW